MRQTLPESFCQEWFSPFPSGSNAPVLHPFFHLWAPHAPHCTSCTLLHLTAPQLPSLTIPHNPSIAIPHHTSPSLIPQFSVFWGTLWSFCPTLAGILRFIHLCHKMSSFLYIGACAMPHTLHHVKFYSRLSTIFSGNIQFYPYTG